MILLSFGLPENNSTFNEVNKSKSDTGILRTDSVGNILGGDLTDWNFDKNYYSYFLKYKEFFYRPFIQSEPHPAEMPAPIFSEIEADNAKITWHTEREKDFKKFVIERKSMLESDWIKVGSVSAQGYSNSKINYKFIDRRLPVGVYAYRLKLYYLNDKYSYEYSNMPSLVFIKSPKYFQFYPPYPNPVKDTINFSFYLPKKDIVSLYFVSGTDTTFVLHHDRQENGYYKLTLDKKSLGFENEIKRLFIDCESCGKKKNFGDIQF